MYVGWAPTYKQTSKQTGVIMESINLLSGKNTRKSNQYDTAQHNGSNCNRTTIVWILVGIVVIAVGGYALTTTPLYKIKTTSSTAAQDGASTACPTTRRQPTVLLYNRVPKAGSSSMTNLLSKLSSKHDFQMLGWFDLPSHDFDAVKKAVEKALKNKKKTVIAQHFHFPEIIHEDVGYINVMREPISRCTSQYYYLRYGDRAEKDRKKVLDKFGDLSIDECIDTGKYKSCFNCDGWKQSLFFCGKDGGKCDDMSPNEVLERAKRIIDEHYIVGAIEDFEGTVAVMEKLYPSFFKGGVDLLKKVKPQRVTQGVTKEYIPPSNASREIITTLLEQDTQLYNYVLTRLDHYKSCLILQ